MLGDGHRSSLASFLRADSFSTIRDRKFLMGVKVRSPACRLPPETTTPPSSPPTKPLRFHHPAEGLRYSVVFLTELDMVHRRSFKQRFHSPLNTGGLTLRNPVAIMEDMAIRFRNTLPCS